MTKQIVFGIVWCLVLYFAACILVGAVAGFIASANLKPGEDAAVAGAQAGAHAVQTSRPFIGVGAIAVAAIGSYLRLLPGTRG